MPRKSAGRYDFIFMARKLELRIKGLTVGLLQEIVKLIQNRHKKPKLNYKGMVYQINGINYIPDTKMVQEAKELVKDGWIEELAMKDYLAGMWN